MRKLTISLMMLCMVSIHTTSRAQTTIAVVSDPHVMASGLLESGAETQSAWTSYYAGQRKMLPESAGLFTQFVDAVKSSADIVLVTGDLTKDGEEASHEFVRTKLATLTAAGKKVFVIPGNHDLGEEGNHTKFKADGTTENAPVLSASNFAAFYDGFGYGTGCTVDENGSLSYVAEPVEGLVLLGIDSHTGSVPSATLTWLCNQANTANVQGKQVIAMMHHPLIEHIKGASNFIATYTVGNPVAVRDALIDAGVKVILTGHFHTSDIAYDWNDDEANGIYDINTGSLISYPCDYRMLTLSQDMQTLDVATSSLNPAGCEEWLRDRLVNIAKDKMNAKAGALVSYAATYIHDLAVFAADLFILHAKGDENSAANKTERDDIESTYTRYKANSIYNAVLGYGNISDASVYSVLDNKSNYGDTHERQTADRTLTLSLSHGETGINTIATENENRQTIYTLQGTKTDHLPRGLYIQNGKKIIMKK